MNLRTSVVVAAIVFMCTRLLAQDYTFPSWYKAGQSVAVTVAPSKEKPNIVAHTVTVQMPVPLTSLAEIEKLNPGVAKVLPGLADMLKSAVVSPKFKLLFESKTKWLANKIPLNNENYYDCAAILNLTHPATKLKSVLIQADMDVDTDGTDPVRFKTVAEYEVALTSATFQPALTYQWDKPASVINPFTSHYEQMISGINQVEKQVKDLFEGKNSAWERQMRNALLGACSEERNGVKNLLEKNKVALASKRSLVSSVEPFIVIPKNWSGINDGDAHTCKVGDYAIVVYKEKIFPAIVADLGPEAKIGEASLRLNREIWKKASGAAGAVSGAKATYLIFPGTAAPEDKRDLINLKELRQKVRELLNAMGGITVDDLLHDWNK